PPDPPSDGRAGRRDRGARTGFPARPFIFSGGLRGATKVICPADCNGARMREELLAFVSRHGTLLEPDAVEFLLAQNDPVGCVEALLETRPDAPFVLTLHDVQGAREIGRQAATRLRSEEHTSELQSR